MCARLVADVESFNPSRRCLFLCCLFLVQRYSKERPMTTKKAVGAPAVRVGFPPCARCSTTSPRGLHDEACRCRSGESPRRWGRGNGYRLWRAPRWNRPHSAAQVGSVGRRRGGIGGKAARQGAKGDRYFQADSVRHSLV